MPPAVLVLVLVLGQVTWGTLESPDTPARHRPDRQPPSAVATPAQTIRAYTRSYELLSRERLAALLTADFRFHGESRHGDSLYTFGIDRDAELSVVDGLITGVQDGPAARHVRMRADDLVEAEDPEHPDSIAQYRLVAIRKLTFDIETTTGKEFRSNPNLHVVHLVRGDAAVLLPGQPADSSRWYIRRWLEDIDGLNARLNGTEGDCAQDDASAASGAALAIHPLRNPACPTLDLTCDLPEGGTASLDLFDVMGRRVNHKTIAAASAGPVRVQAGAGAKLAPGAYWVRLVQGPHRTTKMVIVAK